MLTTSLVMLFAAQGAANPADQPTLPRQADTQPYEQQDTQGRPTDPLFDRKLVATDDASFVLNVVETSRQSVRDVQGAAGKLSSESLRGTAADIGRQSESTLRELEALAKRKGWRLPESNPDRASSLPTSGPHRASANFIVNQITAHQTIVAQFRAQIAGKGDPELKRTLRKALPGYEQNLQKLLAARL